jgi:hypothetical protein
MDQLFALGYVYTGRKILELAPHELGFERIVAWRNARPKNPTRATRQISERTQVGMI